MNILVIHEVDWVKKITYEIHHLSEFFSKFGHSVYALDVPNINSISFDKSNFETINEYHRLYDDAKVKLYRTPVIPIKGLHRISAYFFSYNIIKKILKENNIDIVLLFGVVTNGKATIKACRELHIPVFHRTLDIVHEMVREKFLRKFVIDIEKEIYPQFDVVLCQTIFMKNWVEKEMKGRNVKFIPQGVDSKIMKPLPKDKELQKKLGLDSKDDVVMYLGTVYSFSGLDEIIKRIPTIINEIPNFKLLIVGGGPDLGFFKDFAKKYHVEERIIFTDFVPYTEVSRYASLAEIFINPFRINEITSRLSPVKIFDLLACGKPVIATPLEGLLHDFPKDSEVIIYSDLEDFHNKIISVLKMESLNEIGRKGRDFVEKNFTWTKVAEKILSEFSQVIKPKTVK